MNSRDSSGQWDAAASDSYRPDTPRLELDELLLQLISRAEDVLATQDRLRGLLAANQMVIGDLALPVVLHRIVEAARQLVNARYCALGVLAPSGGLEEFIYAGVSEQVAKQIGHLPEGKGLLGALIDDPRPIRLRAMSDDARSVGFPPNHPPMTTFLGVPLRVRNEVFGNLYLADRLGGEFTAEDEELVVALAATAGVAIENARLYDEARRRQEWLQASAKITRQLLSIEGEDPLQLIARQTSQIADADIVTVVLPTVDSQRLMVEVAEGEGADVLRGSTYSVEKTLAAKAMDTGEAVLINDASEDHSYTVHMTEVVPVGPVMALPLLGRSRLRGALLVGRLHGRRRFTEADLDMATTFANHAALSLELADAREDQQRMVLLEDRDRIARDLHDHVIQRLFATGLTVQSVASALESEPSAPRLARVIGDIDETIRQIRTSIFQLRGPLGPQTGTVRAQMLAVVEEVTPLLGFAPRVRFSGPIDEIVPDHVIDDLTAVLREALTNVARHAQAGRADIEISAKSGRLALEVTDNGVGMGDVVRRSGLANLGQRAERHGGSLTLTGAVVETSPMREGEGTRLLWTIPLS